MEPKWLLAYFVIGFILTGWRLDALEEKKRQNGQQEKSGLSKALAVSWLFFWALPITLCILKFLGATWREICRKTSESDIWSSKARLL